VDAGNGPTSINNSVDFNGSSIQDIVNRLQSSTGTHKKYVKEITSLAKELQKSRTITKEQAVELKNAADGSSIGTAAVQSSSHGVTLSGGTLTVASNSSWGSGSVSGIRIDSGTLDLSGGFIDRPLTLSGSGGIITNSSGGSPVNLDVYQGAGLSIYGGSVTDSVGLTKTGTGTLTLTGINTYTGATVISAGTLDIAGSLNNTSGITITAGGTLRVSGAGNILTLSGGISNGGVIRVVPGSTLNASGVLTFVNDGVIDLTGGTVLLPATFTNGAGGILLANSPVPVNSISRTSGGFSVVIDGESGCTYQLQQAGTPGGPFTNVGDALSGTTGTTLTLSNLDLSTLPGVYRIIATP
jgi:autotransporter-associated beta strand protein